MSTVDLPLPGAGSLWALLLPGSAYAPFTWTDLAVLYGLSLVGAAVVIMIGSAVLGRVAFRLRCWLLS